MAGYLLYLSGIPSSRAASRHVAALRQLCNQVNFNVIALHFSEDESDEDCLNRVQDALCTENLRAIVAHSAGAQLLYEATNCEVPSVPVILLAPDLMPSAFSKPITPTAVLAGTLDDVVPFSELHRRFGHTILSCPGGSHSCCDLVSLAQLAFAFGKIEIGE